MTRCHGSHLARWGVAMVGLAVGLELVPWRIERTSRAATVRELLSGL